MNLIPAQPILSFPLLSSPLLSSALAQVPPLPLQSLKSGQWFKLICGASYQHIPTVRSLAIAYALAGADCIDIAADPAIITALREAIVVAQTLAPIAQNKGFSPNPNPWLMVSLNDGEDPHFRKAEFDPNQCPSNCPRPCQKICPADAIDFSASFSGVIDALCYGCGRCLPICPIGQISARSYVYRPEVVASMVMQAEVDAVEIHTQIGRLADFTRLWQAISPQSNRLKLIAISCPDGDGLIDYLRSIYNLVSPLDCALIWQTDGRPMSGDIGDGATRACLKLGQKVLTAKLPGFVQLAGGTNAHTIEKARSLGLLEPDKLAGIAYGSYARVLLQPILNQLPNHDFNPCDFNPVCPPPTPASIEDHPTVLWQAVAAAHNLICQLKGNRSKV